MFVILSFPVLRFQANFYRFQIFASIYVYTYLVNKLHTLILWHELPTFLNSISETQRTWHLIKIMKSIVETWKFSMWIQHSEYIYQCSFSWIKSQLSSFMYNTVEARLTVVWKLIYKRHTIQLLFSFKTVHFSFKTQNIHATVVSFSRH